jgi:hypothetical protein
MQQRRAFSSLESLIVLVVFTTGLLLFLPLLLNQRLFALPPLTSAALYGALALPALIAFFVGRYPRKPQGVENIREVIFVAFGLPCFLAFLVALKKLLAWVMLSL